MFASILITLCLVALLLLLIYIYFTWNFNYWKRRGINGPKPRPLFGNFPSAITGSRNMQYDIEEIYRKYKSTHGFVGVFITVNPQLLILDPMIARNVLIGDFKKFHINSSMEWVDKKRDPIAAENPFFLKGIEWKNKRADITPGLTPARIKAVYPVMLEICSELTNYIEKELSKNLSGALNMRNIARKYSIGVVSNVVYGIESGVFDSDQCILFDMSVHIFNTFVAAVDKAVILSTFPFIKYFYRPSMVDEKSRIFFTNLLEEAIELRKKSNINRVDYLDYLIQLNERKNLSTIEMVSHTLAFLVDGFETSSTTLTHSIHMLAKHENVQDRLRKEILEATNESGLIEYEKLYDLPFLDQCLQETLRLFPPLLFTSKTCTEPATLTDSKDKIVNLRPMETVIIPTFSFHRDERFYVDPDKYDPDRFSPENGGVKKYSDMGVFMPFGDGPRICLGKRFGQSQVKSGIVEIIKNWKISVNEKTKKELILAQDEFLCQWEGGVYLNFERIK